MYTNDVQLFKAYNANLATMAGTLENLHDIAVGLPITLQNVMDNNVRDMDQREQVVGKR